ncbi:MAG: hypothetical protein AAF823_12515 [Planctomycetota bacterium]
MIAALVATLGWAGVSAAEWRPLGFVTAEARASGVELGGEGCQWPQDIEADAVDGSFVLFCTDVGGIWRSLNGGATWEPANVGFTPRGASAATIDPNFPDRVLAVGMNSMGSEFNGVYLSEDRAGSWRPVYRAAICGFVDRREKIAFDPSTRDDAAGLTRVVYWTRTADRAAEGRSGMEVNPGLYRSDDGGRTWHRLDGQPSEIAGNSQLAVHPTAGRLYVANERGVFVSNDRGESLVQVHDASATGLSVSVGAPDSVWISVADGAMVSHDRGHTWERLPGKGLEEPLRLPSGERASEPRRNVHFQDIKVSPVDPRRMVMTSEADNWRWHRHASHDGGRTWTTSATKAGPAFMPQNEREGLFAWHPQDADRVWSFGGDWPTASHDGGLAFEWSGQGQNAVYVGGLITINPHEPGLLFFSSQDYNGAVSSDGGKTWRYTPISGEEWGGFTYGGVAVSGDVLAVGDAEGWGTMRRLSISRDGGATWSLQSGIEWAGDRSDARFGYDGGLVHPHDPSLAFIAQYRTDDGGLNWSPMEGVSGVISADESGRLYGALHRQGASHVVTSEDEGRSWQALAEVPGFIDDLAATPDGESVYIAANNRLWRLPTTSDPDAVIGNRLQLLDTPKTGTDRHRVATVAVDPRNGSRVYAGQRIDTHAADVGVIRSDDGGHTWTNLNLTEPLDGTRLDGGREPQCLRVDPHSGDLIVTTGCYGIWRYVDRTE